MFETPPYRKIRSGDGADQNGASGIRTVLSIRDAVAPKHIHRALAYYRNHGMRATLHRIRSEIRNHLRRRRGHPQLYTHAFDRAGLLERLQDPNIRLVIFDIFDTLISRPLIDPESTKRLVATRLGRPDFVARRHAAEASRRVRSEKDVSLAAICYEYTRLYGDEDNDAIALQAAEEAVELALARPQPMPVELLRIARRAGKRVVLASDMFLSETHLRRMLERCGITDFDAIYVSSETGVRKSTGDLYQHLLREERLLPQQALMIGDHPVSDQQIPAQLGLHVIGIESPRALAEHAPRFTAWQARALASDVGTELWIGLIAQRFFNTAAGASPIDRAALTQGGRQNIGYAIVGPLLVAFSEWLLAQTAADGIERLYFLAREGQLMQAVFDALYGGTSEIPCSCYLVLSRRTISVPMLRTREDILDIARTTYLPNTLSEFIFRRYGLKLDDARLDALDAQGLWPRGRLVKVSGGQIDDLLPVLDALADEILALACEERGAILAYLSSVGLEAPGRAAVVDVGYAGSIQGRLCEILERPLDGYYMVTRAAARRVQARFGVRIQSCFGHELESPDQCALLRYNVPLEMLMGSDDPQIRRYRLNAKGIPRGEFQDLSHDELISSPMRRELREGALDFARDYRALREAGLGPPRIDPRLAEALFADFWEGVADSERRAIYAIATDDHYCGMGIVHFATFLP